MSDLSRAADYLPDEFSAPGVLIGHSLRGAADAWGSDPSVRAYAEAAFASLQPVLSDHDLSQDSALAGGLGCGTGLLTERLVASGAVDGQAHASPQRARPAARQVVIDQPYGRGSTTNGTRDL